MYHLLVSCTHNYLETYFYPPLCICMYPYMYKKIHLGYYFKFLVSLTFFSILFFFLSSLNSSAAIQEQKQKFVHDLPLFSPHILCLLSPLWCWFLLMSCPKYVYQVIFQTMIASSLKGIKMSNVKIIFFQLVMFTHTHKGVHILKINIKTLARSSGCLQPLTVDASGETVSWLHRMPQCTSPRNGAWGHCGPFSKESRRLHCQKART